MSLVGVLLGIPGVTVGVEVLGAFVMGGLSTAAGFSKVVAGMTLVGAVLGMPGVTVGMEVLGALVMGGLSTAAGFS
jgi:hypothetical protein